MPTLADRDTYVFVQENQTLAGREFRDGNDAQARPLVVCFFQRDTDAVDQVVVTRMDIGGSGMKAMDVTPAELALRLGFVMHLIADRSALNIERVVEIALLRMSRMSFAYEHWTGVTNVHTYTLTNE